MRRSWSELETGRLYAMLEGRQPIDRIAQAFGRPVEEVEEKARALTAAPPRPVGRPRKPKPEPKQERGRGYQPWSPDETRRLKSLNARGMNYEEIAEEMRRPVASVRTKAIREGLRKFNRAAAHIWTSEEVSALREMKLAGASAKEIGAKLGIDPMSVRTKANRERIFKWGKERS